jgi:CspA family cold shock protein
VVDEIVDTNPSSHDDSIPKYVGQVKWWNDKLGFGFATIVEGVSKGREVFIHHTCIVAPATAYRSLRKNEFVSFNVTRGLNGEQATNVITFSMQQK